MITEHKSLINRIFDGNYELIDGVDDIFELDLALWEYESLSKDELIKRSAYFKKIEGRETNHYKECNLQNLEEIHRDSSFRTKVFFLNGKYSTGYATHSLFPYRGKFHPQMIRALLNIAGVKVGDTVLDPMGGSGTLATEANLIGINAVSVDVSPFCSLMARVKTFALDLDIERLRRITKDVNQILEKFNKKRISKEGEDLKGDSKKAYEEVALLAYLDTMGFASRSSSSLKALFPRVLERYMRTIENWQTSKKALGLEIGKTKVFEGNAVDLNLEDSSVDAIVTSPPYSFAIDYLKNDQPQLEYLGYNLDELRTGMIGLQGRGVDQKLKIYFNQMEQVLREMKRVSKVNAPVIIIIGTNDVQTRGVNLQEKVIKLAEGLGLGFSFEMLKPIRGLQNTMKAESILFFNNAG